MPPKDKKKKKAKKAPAYLTGTEHLAPWGLQAGQLVRSSLGVEGTVLGVKLGGTGSELWVRWTGGLEAPADTTGGVCAAPGAEQLRRDIDARKCEAMALAAKWEAYNAEQARKVAEAAKAAAKKKKKAPATQEALARAGQAEAAAAAAEAG
ncbi:hypothetical protein ABPG75_005403 [Micractinium tetrahymenae]